MNRTLISNNYFNKLFLIGVIDKIKNPGDLYRQYFHKRSKITKNYRKNRNESKSQTTLFF